MNICVVDVCCRAANLSYAALEALMLAGHPFSTGSIDPTFKCEVI